MRRSNNAQEDINDIRRSVRYFNSASTPNVLSIFPEGAFPSKKTHPRSCKYAKEKGRPDLKRRLLPRTVGTYAMLREMNKKKFSMVYEMTIVYKNVQVEDFVSESFSVMDLVDGNFPACHIHLRGIPISTVPLDNQEEFEKWLDQLFVDKDATTQAFYKDNGAILRIEDQSVAVDRLQLPGEFRRTWFELLEIGALMVFEYQVLYQGTRFLRCLF